MTLPPEADPWPEELRTEDEEVFAPVEDGVLEEEIPDRTAEEGLEEIREGEDERACPGVLRLMDGLSTECRKLPP